MNNKLWTRDFTIITLGSAVSMLGNAMAGFSMSLLVLDYTRSTILYALYIAIFTLPQIIMPIFSGAILDRYSRKKTIYTLDFVSAGLFGVVAVLLGTGWFSFPLFAVYCFLLGSINSVYMVAYDSFYPLLISEGNYQKAYSVTSVLETLSAVMIPVSTYVYNLVGIAPLLGFNAVTFLIAAVMETRIGAKEEYIEKQRKTANGANSARQVLADIREGFSYLRLEKGLLAVSVYFMFLCLAGGASDVITLPYFKDNYNNGEYIYMLVWGMAVLGRMLGGAAHYRIRLPVEKKYTIAMVVYLANAVLHGVYLFCHIPAMMVMCFMTGVFGVTSYTIRISATQSYVPDEKKGRFNGAFNMMNTVGSFAGQLLGGALCVVLPMRVVLAVFMAVNAAAAILFIGGNKKAVEKIYNTHN